MVKAFSGVDLIIHAGDIGSADILEHLGHIAPVVAVRGNMDRGQWAQHLPEREMVHLGRILIYILHDIHTLDLEPSAADISAVIIGHSHRPELFQRDGVLYLNPGGAGHPRFHYPVSVAILSVKKDRMIPQIRQLDP